MSSSTLVNVLALKKFLSAGKEICRATNKLDAKPAEEFHVLRFTLQFESAHQELEKANMSGIADCYDDLSASIRGIATLAGIIIVLST